MVPNYIIFIVDLHHTMNHGPPEERAYAKWLIEYLEDQCRAGIWPYPALSPPISPETDKTIYNKETN